MVSIQRHLLNLRSLLQDGESERLWAQAERLETTHVGALMVTDRRVLFSGLGFFQPSLDAVPFAAVRRPALDHGPRRPATGPLAGMPGLARLRERGARDVLRFAVLDEERRYSGRAADMQRLHDGLRAAMTTAGVDPDATSDGGFTAELERLAALHVSGALTDAEFADAKRALLARPAVD